MTPNPEELRRHYDSLSDLALVEINPTELTPVAQQVLEEVLEARGLLEDGPPTEGAESASDSNSIDAEQEQLVVAATYDTPSEAQLAVALLRSAQSPCGVMQSKYSTQIDVMVPTAHAEDAQGVLNAEISDEELAAQAEAAGAEEDEDGHQKS